jgi:hypothetical protein
VHQENLCAKSFPGFEHVTSVVTKVVNSIQSKAVNHRQFRNLLSELGAQCGEMVHYSEVWWLSRSKMLKHIFSLREKVQDFMESKEKFVHKSQDPQ